MLTNSGKIGLEKLNNQRVDPKRKEINWRYSLNKMDIEFIERYLRKIKLEKLNEKL